MLICEHLYNYSVYVSARSFGVLVWEVATYGETPYKQLQTSDIMAMARDESLKLDRFVLVAICTNYFIFFVVLLSVQ